MAATTLSRPAADEYDTYYAGYIAGVPDQNLLDLLSGQIEETAALLARVPEARAGWAYAPGKWTIKEVVGHLADAERIMAYRALRIGRADTTPLPGFEQDDYVRAGDFDTRLLADLAREFQAIRRTTIELFQGLGPAAFLRRGTASGMPVSVRALAYIIAGHERHHVEVLKTRYGLDG